MHADYRTIFLGLKDILQRHDPFGLQKLYSGERFEGQIYGYETTTILEKLGERPTIENIECFLHSYAGRHHYEQNQNQIKAAAREIHRFLLCLKT